MASTAVKSVHVQYFALLREQRGLSGETVDTQAATLRDLYEELRQRHGFSLPSERMTVSVNACFGGWNDPLQPDDTVVFIPPVAGG